MQTFRLTNWVTSRLNDECEIVVRCIGAIFYICWLPAELAAAPALLESYLRSVHLLKEAFDKDVDDFSDDGESDIDVAERLKQPFDSLMSELAPPDAGKVAYCLHDYLYPDWFLLKAALAEDHQTIRPCHLEGVTSPYSLPGEYMHAKCLVSLDLESWVPNWYSSREVQLVPQAQDHPLLHEPSKVLVDGGRTACFFKGFGPGCRGTTRELRTFRQLADAITHGRVPSDIRVCRLHGLVRDKDADAAGPMTRLVGMLITYIDPKDPGLLGTLQHQQHRASQSDRRRWAHDIEMTLGQLHQVRCVWGDAKPENVLVDGDNQVWLIDFGGGNTAGWVENEHRETEQGDLGALERIKTWLHEPGC